MRDNQAPGLNDVLEGNAVLITEGNRPFWAVKIVVPEHKIPILVWTWEPVGFVMADEPDRSKVPAGAKYYEEGEDRYNHHEAHWTGWAVWKDRRRCSASLMNFRRYGWATAPGSAPESGWSGPSEIWANKSCGPVPCRTVEEVVVASLAVVIAHAARHFGIPGELIEHVTARPLYRQLVDEVLRNGDACMWAQRTVNDDNGALSLWDVQVELPADPIMTTLRRESNA